MTGVSVPDKMSTSNPNLASTTVSPDAPAVIQTVAVGPLTTTFTPNGQCSDPVNVGDTTYTVTKDGRTQLMAVFNYRQMLQCETSKLMPDCLPTAFSSAYISVGTDISTSYPVFSPGNACPAGYVANCTMQSSVTQFHPGSIQAWPVLKASETAIGCCPNNYACGQSFTDCVSTVSAVTGETAISFFPQAFCNAALNKGPMGTRPLQGNDKAIVTALRMIYVQDPSDTNSSGVPGSSSSSSPVSSSPPLTTAATIAISISIILGLILCGVVGYIVYDRRRRKQKKAKEEQDPGDHDDTVQLKAELDAWDTPNLNNQSRTGTMRGELDAQPGVYEMSGPDVYELAENSFPPAELDASSTGAHRRTNSKTKHISMELHSPTAPDTTASRDNSKPDPSQDTAGTTSADTRQPRLSRIEALAKDISKARKYSYQD